MRGRVAVKILTCTGCHGVRCGDQKTPKTCGHSLESIGEAVWKIGNTSALLSRPGPPNRTTYVLRRINRKAFRF